MRIPREVDAAWAVCLSMGYCEFGVDFKAFPRRALSGQLGGDENEERNVA